MFSDPKKNIEQFGLISGMTVADLGSGSGAYSMLASLAVGDHGKVYSIDVQKELLSRLKAEATKQNISNIETIWGDIEKHGGIKLRDGCVDCAIAANIFFQVPDKSGMRDEIKRILKTGGKAIVIDWTDSFGGLGPEQSAVFSLTACKELFTNDFLIEKEFNAGAHHYGIMFKKK